jgi:hypothetical protein
MEAMIPKRQKQGGWPSELLRPIRGKLRFDLACNGKIEFNTMPGDLIILPSFRSNE